MSTDSTTKVYSIYALVYPDTHKPFYVGKTINPMHRMREHLYSESLWVVRELSKVGKAPRMVILQEYTGTDEKVVTLLEKAWINRHLDQGDELINSAFSVNNDARFKYPDSNRFIISDGIETDCEGHTMEKPDKPQRRYQITITAGSDDLPYLINMLEEQIQSLRDWPTEKNYDGFSGGYSGNHSCTLKFNPDVTHDSYFVENEKYLEWWERKEQAS